MKNCSAVAPLESLAAALIDGIRAELFLTPKPGLVDLMNNGSHPDLTLTKMSRSIVLLGDYLAELIAALGTSATAAQLIAIGQRAEQKMLQQLGTNCHRGGIFLCGLLLVSAARTDPDEPTCLQAAVKQTAAEFFPGKSQPDSHGEQVRKEFPRAGIVNEALQGLPAVFDLVMPSVLGPHRQGCRVIYLALAKLMQRVEDSTSLYRCGPPGLAKIRRGGRELERCLAKNKDPFPLLLRLDREFRQRQLTMGGVADLLGIGLGYAGYLAARKAPTNSGVNPGYWQPALVSVG